MQVVRTVGLDIAKSIFQVHGVDGLAKWSSGSVKAALCSGVLSEVASVPGGH